MVAYSFQPRFVAPILAGAKRQTIRGERARHAKRGEEVQLYTGMRTRHCRLIQRVRCCGVERVEIDLERTRVVYGVDFLHEEPDPERFAREDGFADWHDLCRFWDLRHPTVTLFRGVLIRWQPLTLAEAA